MKQLVKHATHVIHILLVDAGSKDFLLIQVIYESDNQKFQAALSQGEKSVFQIS
jgi:hypothetical protein